MASGGRGAEGACGGWGGSGGQVERVCEAELHVAMADEPAWLVVQWLWMESPHQRQGLTR